MTQQDQLLNQHLYDLFKQSSATSTQTEHSDNDNYNDAEANVITFPKRLHHLLDQASSRGFDHIISWLPSGNGFFIRDKQAFQNEVMPSFATMTRYKSFVRQLNIYGFQRIQNGQYKGGYTHPMLWRDNMSLCRFITRVGIKKTPSKIKPKPIAKQHPMYSFTKPHQDIWSSLMLSADMDTEINSVDGNTTCPSAYDSKILEDETFCSSLEEMHFDDITAAPLPSSSSSSSFTSSLYSPTPLVETSKSLSFQPIPEDIASEIISLFQ